MAARTKPDPNAPTIRTPDQVERLRAILSHLVDSLDEDPRSLTDDDLLGLLHASKTAQDLGAEVKARVLAVVAERRPAGYGLRGPAVGSVSVTAAVAEVHHHMDCLEVIAQRVFSEGQPELPATVRAFLEQTGRVLPSTLKLRVTALDELGLPRAQFITRTENPDDRTATYTPPKT